MPANCCHLRYSILASGLLYIHCHYSISWCNNQRERCGVDSPHLLNNTTLEGSYRPSVAQVSPQVPGIAAAKGVHNWGEMNFSLYGFLFGFNTAEYILPSQHYSKCLKRRTIAKVCYSWKDEIDCDSSTCRFHHCYSWCGETTRPQCIHEHQSVPRGECDILTMLTLLLIICIYLYSV